RGQLPGRQHRPVVGGFMIWASAAIFAFTALSAVVALVGSTTPKVLLYKDCAATALIGLIFLGSCVVVRKPVVFYMAQRYGTDGTHDGMANFDKMWDTYRDFRTSMYVISYLWAALFLIQAAGTALIIRWTSYSTAYNYDQVLPLVATGLGILGSIALGRYFARRGKALGTADNTAPGRAP
ncbi:MAG: VC0807 family protein, partial [Candidatus Dormibacteraceae bacterium]